LRSLWMPIGETIAVASQGDRPRAFEKAQIVIEELRMLYPYFDQISASNAGFDNTLELQGLAEFYADFAPMDFQEKPTMKTLIILTLSLITHAYCSAQEQELQVSTGGLFTCAIDDDGVKCWGKNEQGQLDVPSLIKPRFVSAGYKHACAIDDDGVKCW